MREPANRACKVQRLHHPCEESSVWPLLGSVVWSILAIATGIPILLIVALLCPICLALRWLSNVLGKKQNDDGRNSQVLHAMFVFAGKLHVQTLQDLILYRVIPKYPKLKYKMLNQTGPWIADPKFHIDNHVFSASGFGNEGTLWCLEGLTHDKPPWELQVFECSEETIALFRYQHNLADIHVLVNLLCTALADTRTSYLEVSHRNTLQFCIKIIRACILAPLTILFWMLESSKDENILTNEPLWTGRIHLTWSSAISLTKVTRIKQVTRSTTNSVMLSVLAGAIRKIFQSCGVTQPTNMQVLIPMSQYGQVWPVVVPLAVGTEGAVPRIWDTRAILRKLKSNSEQLIGFLFLKALLSIVTRRVAYSILTKLIHHKASIQFSSVIGPESSLLVGGCTLKSLYAMFPPPNSDIGLAVTIITYAGKIFITVLSDSSLSAVSSVLLHNLKSQIDTLDNLLKNRKAPNDKKNPIYRFRNATRSPIKELAHRLSHIQHEILRINNKDYNEGSCNNLNMLKAEFTYVLKEIQRRKTSQDSIELTVGNLRAISCPFVHAISRTPSIARPRSALPSPYCVVAARHTRSHTSPIKYFEKRKWDTTFIGLNGRLSKSHKDVHVSKNSETLNEHLNLNPKGMHNFKSKTTQNHIDAEINPELSILTENKSITIKGIEE